MHPAPADHGQNALRLRRRRRRRFRILALGALAFILLQITLLIALPTDGDRTGLLGLIMADALVATVVGIVLVLSLRKN